MREHITKKYIREALILLMLQKNFKDINVQELVEKAGVSRATFYRNFVSIDEVLDSYFKVYFEELDKVVQARTSDKDKAIFIILDLIKYENVAFKVTFDQGEVGVLLKYLFPLLESIIHTNHEVDLNSSFEAGTLCGLIVNWCQKDFKSGTQEIFNHYLSFFGKK